MSKILEHMPKGVTRRWIVNVMSVVIAVVVVIEIVIGVFVHMYYYDMAKARANELCQGFSLMATVSNTDFRSTARQYIENFEHKDKLEVQIIDTEGNIIITSNGFDPGAPSMPDYESALAAESTVLVKVQTVGTGVGVHTVQNHLDAMLMGSIHHLPEVLQGAQHGIGNLVVAGIVAVAGKALADGVQIEDRHTQGCNIVQFFGNSLEITAEKVVIQHLTVGQRPPVHLFVPIVVDGVGLQLAGEVTPAAAVEPVGEDLVHGGTLGPVGGGEVCRDTADLPAVTGFHIGLVAEFKQPEAAGLGGDPEEVEKQSALLEAEGSLENIVGSLLLFEVHGHCLGSGTVLMVDDALDLGGLDGGGDVDVQCTDLIGDQRTEGIFVLQLLAVEQNSHNGLL